MPSKILIIDDESSIREALSGILQDEGFQSVTAASAEEGLELLARQDVHLILLDIWMRSPLSWSPMRCRRARWS